MNEEPENSCLICNRPVENYVPEYCCNGHHCGCRGEPLNPCTCSLVCENAFFAFVGYSLNTRRVMANIPRYDPNLDTPSLI